MPKLPTDDPFFEQALSTFVSVPIRGMTALAQMWCWQLGALTDVAALALAPWHAALQADRSGGGPFDRAAAQSLFEIAYCLGEAGEQHPFPD